MITKQCELEDQFYSLHLTEKQNENRSLTPNMMAIQQNATNPNQFKQKKPSFSSPKFDGNSNKIQIESTKTKINIINENEENVINENEENKENNNRLNIEPTAPSTQRVKSMNKTPRTKKIKESKKANKANNNLFLKTPKPPKNTKANLRKRNTAKLSTKKKKQKLITENKQISPPNFRKAIKRNSN